MRTAWLLPLLVCAPAAFGQDQTLIKTNFEDGDGGWKGFGQTAQLTVTHDPSETGDSKGALKFAYGVNKGEFNAIILGAQPGSLAGAASISFQIKTDANTPMVVSLQKANGARYVAIFTCPKDTWQPVQLSLADFSLSSGKDDPKDPDGKLEAEQIGAIAIGDLSQMFAQGNQDHILNESSIKTGPHTLLIDRFSVSRETVPAACVKSADGVLVDSLVHPQLGWFVLGGVDLSHASGAPLSGKGLQAQYNQMPGHAVVVGRNFTPGSLAGAKSLELELAATQATKLVVQVEQTDGAKYNVLLDIPAGAPGSKRDLKLSDFKVSDDSPVKDGHLDMSQVKTLLLIDASGIIDSANHINSLWIGPVTAKTSG